jgi:hypothetical protein
MRTLLAIGFRFLTVLWYFFGQAARLQTVGVNTLSVPDEILEKLVGVLFLDYQRAVVMISRDS